VVFLMGPTGAGKTELAVELVERLPLEIVSVDSAMVYRGMDIGTAKPDAETRAQAPHALVDIRDPAEPYSAADFRDDATREIERIHARGRVPLLVGGTMLYFRALTRGLSPMPSADPSVRAELAAQAERIGWPAMHQRLADRDPELARRLHPNDAQRIQRALEVLRLTGESPSRLQAHAGERAPWPLIKLAAAPHERSRLHARIEARFNAMMAAGFLAEVEKLHRRPDLDLSKPALRSVGYRQLWRHLSGEWHLAEAERRAVFATRQLAKRQMTWLRRERDLHWFDSESERIRSDVVTFVRTALDSRSLC